ncbi:branched-chain amino acid ABC transporter permease [Limibacillus halophilus]|uniref:Branched-chain amino acid transport system permease protein n=1 Tax=Limibacillus halophilus TaxID=1579333 RepID=A0A839SVT8_9PROT|nr:branched-chain amino acid ABC transporter permease [Limibacillus halophilus]MBB3065814.1 branched-chain amino acid transport system permease protein [Limibacillus halophilus]
MVDRKYATLLLLFFLVLPFVAEALGYGYVTGIATRILILGIAASSLNFILGFGGMVSFGHAAFLGAGAYIVGILSYHATLGSPISLGFIQWSATEEALIAWPLAMLVSGILALLIGAICLRTSGIYFIMITLAFAQMLFFLFISFRDYGGEDGLSLWSRSTLPALDLTDDRQFYYLTLALTALVVLFLGRVVRSRFGMVLKGARDNEQRMLALGFPVYRYKLVAFTLAGAIGGLSGALMANHTEFISPGLLSWHLSGELLVIVILGGIGSLLGPILGALAYIALEEVLSAWTTHWMIFLGPLLIFIVLFARSGLWGWIGGRESGHD